MEKDLDLPWASCFSWPRFRSRALEAVLSALPSLTSYRCWTGAVRNQLPRMRVTFPRHPCTQARHTPRQETISESRIIVATTLGTQRRSRSQAESRRASHI